MVPQLFSLPADSRVAQSIASFADDGQRVPMTPEAFAMPVQGLPTTRATPEGVADLLRLSRRLYVHGFFVYDFVTVGVHYSLMALEAALSHRVRARPKETFQQLIDKALLEHVLDAPDHELVQAAARRLRNSLSHPTMQNIWSPAMAAPAIAQAHRIVAIVFPDET